MQPIDIVERVKTTYKNYIKTAFPITDDALRTQMHAHNELPRSKLRGIKPPFAYTRVPPVWRGDTRVACEP